MGPSMGRIAIIIMQKLPTVARAELLPCTPPAESRCRDYKKGHLDNCPSRPPALSKRRTQRPEYKARVAMAGLRHRQTGPSRWRSGPYAYPQDNRRLERIDSSRAAALAVTRSRNSREIGNQPRQAYGKPGARNLVAIALRPSADRLRREFPEA
jgi:hypothetical protein